MPPPLNIANDFVLFDGVQVVTVTRRNLDGTTRATYPGVNALRRGVTTAIEGNAVVTHARWHFQASTLPATPLPGDTFVDSAGVRWEVLPGVDTLALGTRYQADCKRVS